MTYAKIIRILSRSVRGLVLTTELLAAVTGLADGSTLDDARKLAAAVGIATGEAE
jgi:hypothetical protein